MTAGPRPFGVLNIRSVIVCHCNAVSDRRILAEAGLGACTVEDITSRCAAGGDCGRCIPRIEQVLSIRSGRTLSPTVLSTAS
jgi:bacterioferritin-associated ferredoxin